MTKHITEDLISKSIVLRCLVEENGVRYEIKPLPTEGTALINDLNEYVLTDKTSDWVFPNSIVTIERVVLYDNNGAEYELLDKEAIWIGGDNDTYYLHSSSDKDTIFTGLIKNLVLRSTVTLANVYTALETPYLKSLDDILPRPDSNSIKKLNTLMLAALSAMSKSGPRLLTQAEHNRKRSIIRSIEKLMDINVVSSTSIAKNNSNNTILQQKDSETIEEADSNYSSKNVKKCIAVDKLEELLSYYGLSFDDLLK